MEAKINVELERMMEFLGSNKRADGQIEIDTEHTFKVCMGSIAASVSMGTKYVVVELFKRRTKMQIRLQG